MAHLPLPLLGFTPLLLHKPNCQTAVELPWEQKGGGNTHQHHRGRQPIQTLIEFQLPWQTTTAKKKSTIEKKIKT
jgi:hypothetical protein